MMIIQTRFKHTFIETRNRFLAKYTINKRTSEYRSREDFIVVQCYPETD
jgi:hypothetical protein